MKNLGRQGNDRIRQIVASESLAGELDRGEEYYFVRLDPGARQLYSELQAELWELWFRLRREVYSACGFIESVVGGEQDEHDGVAHAVLVLRRESGVVRPVAGLRLIQKTGDMRLPVEVSFPELGGLPAGSWEASRFIIVDRARFRGRIWAALWAFACGVVHECGGSELYALVDPRLTLVLKRNRIPVRVLSQPRFVPEFASENQAISMGVPALVSDADVSWLDVGSVPVRLGLAS